MMVKKAKAMKELGSAAAPKVMPAKGGSTGRGKPGPITPKGAKKK